ncbi:MAG: two-component system, cell cycle response regulator DivK [Parcubacteria group bacterium Gr01-1014_30]|nr:MAG: two-component system, cell cycle response regulator DivK [Parcubacteria group bacterium Gr01-1014_30]
MKPKILIIEDDVPTIKLFKETFPMAGFEIEILDLGKKAIAMVQEIREGKKEKPDLILLDLILPDINGIEILKEVRKYPETKTLKIYALTNYSSAESNEELNKEGIDKILVKAQYSLKELTEIMREGLK